MNRALNTVDLFSGAGGLTVGFSNVGFNSVLAIDFDKDSCETYKQNFPESKVICGDILSITNEQVLELLDGINVDVIIGGPPCQGFSALGKQLATDPRNQLWKQYLRFVELLKPPVWIMENVPQLLKSQEFVEIEQRAQELGYKIQSKVLNAADYGVPQRRNRAVIIATLKKTLKHPEPTHFDPDKTTLFDSSKKPWASVREAFKDLSLKPTETDLHISRNPTELSMKRYQSIPEGGNRFDLPLELMPNCWKNKPTGSTDVFGRLWWKKPSLTVRTEFFKPEKGRYLHPSENRPITIREGARLQTFPDTFKFVGSNTSIAKQIGNAVPCVLAENIAQTVKEYLLENYEEAKVIPEHHGKHYTVLSNL